MLLFLTQPPLVIGAGLVKMKAVMQKGFTILELLIVVAIVAVISVTVLLTLNPAELLKQSRDSRRISDLDTLRRALDLYLADVRSPSMGTNGKCYIYGDESYTSNCEDTGRAVTPGTMSIKASQATDGTGWIPVNFSQVSSKSPLSVIPVDPVNNAGYGFDQDSFVDSYFYLFIQNASSYELNANMESRRYGLGGDRDKTSTDGGDNPTLYEVGPGVRLNL